MVRLEVGGIMAAQHGRGRWKFGAVLAAVAMIAVGAGGCELFDPKVPNPFDDGKPATAAQVLASAAKAEREAKDRAAAEARAAEAEARAARIELIKGSAQLTHNAERSAAQAAADLKILQANTELTLGNAGARIDGAREQLDRTLADIEARTVQAMTQAAERASALQSVAKTVLDNPVLKTAAAGVGIDTGGLSPLVTLLGGAVATGWLATRGKKNENSNYDEGYARAKAEAAEAKKLRDEARAEAELKIFRLIAQPPSPAALAALAAQAQAGGAGGAGGAAAPAASAAS
jgi:hypothetical protein